MGGYSAQSLESLAAGTGFKVKPDGLGGVLTSRRDMGLPISPDDGDKQPLCAPDEEILEGQGLD